MAAPCPVVPSAVSLRAARQQLLEQPGLRGEAFCAAYTAAADRFLTGLLQAAAGDLHGVALLAVGGYGRGELCPYSDLDVVLVHTGRADVAGLADAVWYPVWDEGVRLDHSVRRPGEVLAMAEDDLRVQLGLLDGRIVAGDASVAEPVLAQAQELWRRRAPFWLPQLAEQSRTRREQHGEVAFLLEPDLKEAAGGLRDLGAVRAAARAVPALADHVDLSSLDEPARLLRAVRVELHRVTNRATDRLLLQEQDPVADALGLPDADALMGAVAGAGRTVAWVAEDTWRRRTLWAPPRRRRRWRRLGPGAGLDAAHAPGGAGTDGGAVVRRVEPGVAVTGDPEAPGEGEVVLGPGADPATDVTLALRVAAVAAERSLPIARSTLAALACHAPHPPAPWPDELRQALVRVLATGRPAVGALEALDQRSLLTRLLPEWAAVRNRPQRNAYHRYTVDRHLLEAAAQAAPLALRVQRPDLLLLGALFHDIGKGFPGDHTAAGIEVVGELAVRIGLAPEDRAVLVDLVRHHLLLADVATRRDLDDPATVSAVAAAVGDRVRLELLAALTEADGLATGPAAWGTWKAGLVSELVRRTAAVLSGGPPPPIPPSLVTDRHRRLMQQVARLGRSIVVGEPPEVTVVAADRPGLLAAVTGVLALQGLDVRSADVAGEGPFAVEVFTVEPARGRWPDWDLVADELEAVLRGTLPLEQRLADQARTYRPTRRASARPVPTQVTVDNEASAVSTVIEVRAEDAVGLLHRVTAVLFEHGLDVVAARVATLGHEVVDAFYVRDRDSGGKLTDPRRLRALDQAVRAAVAQAAP